MGDPPVTARPSQEIERAECSAAIAQLHRALAALAARNRTQRHIGSDALLARGAQLGAMLGELEAVIRREAPPSIALAVRIRGAYLASGVIEDQRGIRGAYLASGVIED